MRRIASIDRFRGIAGILMVFFTLIAVLSDSLPDALRHNLPGSFHFGDTVLPMFLFASGMSLVFFVKKYGQKKDFALDLIERFGSLVLIWVILSPLSGGGMFEMDEVMLCVLLSLPAIFMIGWPDRAIAAVIAAFIIAYIVLMAVGGLPDLRTHYLGGFAAAPFYLPVMLAGILAGKDIERIERLAAPAVILTIALIIIVAPYKSAASPSFMALSATISLLIFILIKRYGGDSMAWKPVEYVGMKPIRYWVLMWIFIMAPIAFFVIKKNLPLPLNTDLLGASAIAFSCMCLLFVMSKGIDMAASRLGIKPGRI